MAKRTIFWQIVIPFVGISLAAILLLGSFTITSARTEGFNGIASELRQQGLSASLQFEDLLDAKAGQGAFQGLCMRLGEVTRTRVTYIDMYGTVLGDSDEDPKRMDNHRDRPEIASAMRGEDGIAVRHSATLHVDMLYVAIPVRNKGEIRGVLRVSMPETRVRELVSHMVRNISIAACLVALFAIVLSLIVSHRISTPLQNMKRAAQHFARGDFGIRVDPENTDEVGGLADAMNWMAAQLDDKIQTVQQQTQEREAILSSMVEGVVAIDMYERIINLNHAAARLLKLDPEKVQGQSIEACIRNVEIQQFAKRALQSDVPVEADLVVHEKSERFLQAHGTRLRNAQGSALGALIVLHDVTRLHRLENVRRDFVANVSHELRTPITSIKGFVETLLEQAPEDTETARRFLEIIARQADRLNSIIEDLLSLSRIEREAERGGIQTESGLVHEVLEAAIQTCRIKAEARRVSIKLTCPSNLKALINRDLLEQAVVNLLDNALKYSGDEDTIELTAGEQDDGVFIRVRDYGCGISAEHLDRLFERFYRVDKDRSRKLGGTGLGLAIVKHIVNAHGGQVTVESAVGQGSAFTILLSRN